MKERGDPVAHMEPVRAPQQHFFNRDSTSLAKIAVILQGTQNKMLTFTQLMDKLAPLMRGDRKSAENKVRVCLSTNKCFVKVPVVPNLSASKRNYWKLDTDHITGKMARRHFNGLLQLFPELVSKIKLEKPGRPPEPRAGVPPRQAEAPGGDGNRRSARFTGSFSIETILESAGPSEPPSGSSGPPREAQQLQSCHASPRSYPIFPAGGSIHREILIHSALAPNYTTHDFRSPFLLFSTELPLPLYGEPPWPLCPVPSFPFYP